MAAGGSGPANERSSRGVMDDCAAVLISESEIGLWSTLDVRGLEVIAGNGRRCLSTE